MLADLVLGCDLLREHGQAGKVAYGINVPYTGANGKTKTLDLALGVPAQAALPTGKMPIGQASEFSRLLFSCEAKSVFTEHSKSQPRLFDELSSSHEIVHRMSNDAIAAGVTVVNVARCFVSPLRQTTGDTLHVSQHRQPHVAQRMIQHLRGLPIRDRLDEQGFDAYTTIVVDCENTAKHTVEHYTDPPAPQEGERDHYDVFVERVVRFYTERFAGL